MTFQRSQCLDRQCLLVRRRRYHRQRGLAITRPPMARVVPLQRPPLRELELLLASLPLTASLMRHSLHLLCQNGQDPYRCQCQSLQVLSRCLCRSLLDKLRKLTCQNLQARHHRQRHLGQVVMSCKALHASVAGSIRGKKIKGTHSGKTNVSFTWTLR